MKLFKWSVILLALLLAGMAMVPMVSADENNQARLADEAKVRELIKPIDADIHQMVDERTLYSLQDGTDGLSGPAKEVLKKYNKNLNEIVGLLVKMTDVNLDDTNRTLLKEIIVTEHFKQVSNDMVLAKRGLKLEDAKVITPKILGVVNMTEELSRAGTESVLSAPAMKLYQTYPDVYGGYGFDDSGLPYNVNGGNSLYKVLTWGSSYPYTYRLYYHDEDHPDPALDATYDAYRLATTGTLEDSAQFEVYSSSIHYSLSYSGSHGYAYPAGNHGSVSGAKQSYMYVSNIWNHDIGTSDTNPSMSMLKMSVPYYPQ
jgi:hypothetical protein